MAGGTGRIGWLGGVAAAAALLLGAAPAGAASTFVQAHGSLSDLAPSTANATDGASADLYAIAGGGHTTFVLFLRDLDPDAAGTVYGTHIHIGTCVPGNGAGALGHFNRDGGIPTSENEVWLDFEVMPGGFAFAVTTVPFLIEPGEAHAMVVHAEPTQAGGPTPGAAGGRIACLPVEF